MPFKILRYNSHTINLPIKSVQFSGLQYIHKVVQLSPLSESRISLSYQKKPSKSIKVEGIDLFGFF